MGATTIQFDVLGRLRAWKGSREVTPRRAAQRRLLSILLLDVGQPVPREVLADRMWGDDPPATATNTIQVHVSGLRQLLGTEVIQTHPTGYALAATPEDMDAGRFTRLVGLARQNVGDRHLAEALETLEHALPLWRGEPYSELSGEAFAVPEQTRLTALHASAEELSASCLLGLGRADEAALHLERLTAEDPFNERLWELLMLAHYRSGRGGSALGDFRRAQEGLGQLGIAPGQRLRDLNRLILHRDPTLGAPAPLAATHDLPLRTTSFLGRARDLASLRELIREHRLVTLVGGPGVGKTSTAVEVAGALLDEHLHGVRFVALASTRTEQDVASTIAASLGLQVDSSDPRQFVRALARQASLLLLDNCEQVVEPVARLAAELLAIPTGPVVLATSRRHLGVPGEQVLRLDALDLPDDPSSVHDPEGALVHAGVRLLLDRVRELDPSFVLTPENTPATLELCRNTGGIPLAIELVARRVPSLGVRGVSRLLRREQDVAPAEGPAALSEAGGDRGANHSPLDQTLRLSTGLLLEDDQRLLQVLSVFAGPFELEHVEAVWEPGHDPTGTAGAVVRLVDASLLSIDHARDGTVRYRLLEPIRDHVSPLLAQSADRPAVQARHAALYLERAVEARRRTRGPEEASAFATIDVEMGDHRLAMAWSRANDDGRALAQHAAALTYYWYARFLGAEGRSWLDEALALGIDEPNRADVLWAAGFLAFAIHDYHDADRRLREALHLARGRGDDGAVARALYGLGRVHVNRRLEDGRSLLLEAAGLLERIDPLGLELAECQLFAGIHDAARGDPENAATLLGAAVERLEQVGHLRQVSKGRRHLAHAALRLGDQEQARGQIMLAEQLARESGDRPALCGALLERALVENRCGSAPAAAQLLLEALAPIPPEDVIDLSMVLKAAAVVLESKGSSQLAAAVIGWIDARYDEADWIPLDEEDGFLSLRQRLAGELGETEASNLHARGTSLATGNILAEVSAALRSLRDPREPAHVRGPGNTIAVRVR